MSTTELRAQDGAFHDVACAHCGLPVPAGLVEPDQPRSYCCHGCHAAWELIHDGSLAGYYAMPERRRTAVAPLGRTFEEFDHPAFHELHVRPHPGGLLAADFHLEGVTCASCVWLVERVPLILPGLARAELDAARGVIHLTWDPTRVSLASIARHLDRLGYRPHPFRGQKAEAARRSEDRAALANIGLAGAIAGNVMLLAVALYGGWFTGMEHPYERYFRWLSLVLTGVSVLGPGRTFFRSAWQALRVRRLHMDVPIALALGAGLARGGWNTLVDRGPIYFDGVVTLVFLLLVGRFLQRRAQRAAADSTELLGALSPPRARRIDRGQTHELPVEALLPGMIVEVRAGETVPADGIVTDGRSSLDLSLLSGESRPVPAGVGDRVYAGTTNLGARLYARVEETGERSRLGRILREVEAGASRRAPVVRLADRLAGGFVAVVLVLAVATALLGWRHDRTAALDRAIALLIVTCPCALALATPLAVSVAIGRAARRGILVKGGDALEQLAHPGRLVLDKTGTVTQGRTALEAWDGAHAVRPWVLALEQHVTHPLADGFRAAWPELLVPSAEHVAVTVGGGITGLVEGHSVCVGSPAFVRATLAEAPRGRTLVASRLTPVWVAVDGQLVAHAGFGDPVRADAASALERLRARGWRPELLSGDDPAVVAEIGRALGLSPQATLGGATPEAKLARIEVAEATGPVVMVGDGVNDAAAIARATVGISVRGGAEASLAAADVFLAREGLLPLVELVDGARRTLDVIHRNLAFSIVYNLIGAWLAMTGRINPMIAAILMPLSSLTVVLASWQGRTFENGPR